MESPRGSNFSGWEKFSGCRKSRISGPFVPAAGVLVDSGRLANVDLGSIVGMLGRKW